MIEWHSDLKLESPKWVSNKSVECFHLKIGNDISRAVEVFTFVPQRASLHLFLILQWWIGSVHWPARIFRLVFFVGISWAQKQWYWRKNCGDWPVDYVAENEWVFGCCPGGPAREKRLFCRDLLYLASVASPKNTWKLTFYVKQFITYLVKIVIHSNLFSSSSRKVFDKNKLFRFWSENSKSNYWGKGWFF